jgi:hypothetical protein
MAARIDRSIDRDYGCEEWVWALMPGDRIFVSDDHPSGEHKTPHTVNGPWDFKHEHRLAWLPCINDQTGARVLDVDIQSIADLISKADGSHDAMPVVERHGVSSGGGALCPRAR